MTASNRTTYSVNCTAHTGKRETIIDGGTQEHGGPSQLLGSFSIPCATCSHSLYDDILTRSFLSYIFQITSQRLGSGAQTWQAQNCAVEDVDSRVTLCKKPNFSEWWCRALHMDLLFWARCSCLCSHVFFVFRGSLCKKAHCM